MAASWIKIGVALLSLTILGFAWTSAAHAEASGTERSKLAPRFAQNFSDHMVIQREKPIRLWGSARPEAELTVNFANQTLDVRADSSGAWVVSLQPMPAGGPYTLNLRDENGSMHSVRDVLIGDVWLCSGQSNMVVPVGEVNLRPAPSSVETSSIRLKTIPQYSHTSAQAEYPEAPDWHIADAESIHDFSAACFLLARELQKTNAVPFGLINASWGGSGIKAWISTAGMKQSGLYDRPLDWLQTYSVDEEKANSQFGDAWETWWQQVNPDSGQPWIDPVNESPAWKPNPPIMKDWKKYDDPSLTGHLGMVWFRKSFDLTQDQAAQDAVLSLGAIDEVDYLWVNGKFIGSTFGWGTERYYRVPGDLLNETANSITVNVLNTWASGGMMGPNEKVNLTFSSGQTIALGDAWSYRKVSADVPTPPRVPWESLGGISGLSNAMISPLEGLQLSGVLWYHGETDTADPEPYENLLNSLIADWRQRFGEDLSFVIVQLPSFGKLLSGTMESGWATIRDAQRKVALAHAATGLVVTIDTGDRNDLHPPDKRAVGLRAAEVAKVVAYGQPGIADGLSPRTAFRQKEDVVLEFETELGKLEVIGAATPIAFELCGSAPGDCHFANARLDGNRIFLSGGEVQNARRVRHCWADAPICNLYGESGLPVSTFEIEIMPEPR